MEKVLNFEVVSVPCPYCGGRETWFLRAMQKTTSVYRVWRCSECKRLFVSQDCVCEKFENETEYPKSKLLNTVGACTSHCDRRLKKWLLNNGGGWVASVPAVLHFCGSRRYLAFESVGDMYAAAAEIRRVADCVLSARRAGRSPNMDFKTMDRAAQYREKLRRCSEGLDVLNAVMAAAVEDLTR